MNTVLRNTITNLYDAVSAPVASMCNALAKRLVRVRGAEPKRNCFMDIH